MRCPDAYVEQNSVLVPEVPNPTFKAGVLLETAEKKIQLVKV